MRPRAGSFVHGLLRMTDTTMRVGAPGAGNTTDATRGQPLALRAQKRLAELEALAAEMPVGGMLRSEIELAMSSVSGLLTGNLDELAQTTAADLNRWLEGTKHLGEVTPRE
jgi:hypothetical protein